MITAATIKAQTSTRPCSQEGPYKGELLRLLAAAVVSRPFRELLLKEPLSAVRQGYHGEAFLLSAEELEILLSIQADSLHDFANQLQAGRELALAKGLNQRSNGHRQVTVMALMPVPELAGAD